MITSRAELVAVLSTPAVRTAIVTHQPAEVIADAIVEAQQALEGLVVQAGAQAHRRDRRQWSR